MSTTVAPPGAEHRTPPSESKWWLGARPESRWESWRRGGGRRSVPHLVLGMFLVAASVVGVLVWSLQVGDRQAVLVLARPVAVGHVLTEQDLRQVSIAADPEVSTVPASDAPELVGRAVATSLPAGSLLSPGVLGPESVPAPGQAVASLALRAGAFPPELAPGAAVGLVFVPAAAGSSASAPPVAEAVAVWPATVVSVIGGAEGQTTVVSVALAESAAREVASIPAGQLAVVLMPRGER